MSQYSIYICHTIFCVVLDNLSCPSLLLVWTPLPTTNVYRGIRLPRKEFRGQQAR